MHQNKSKKILVYFFLLLVVSSISNNAINNFKFDKIKNINITGLDQKENQSLLNKIENLNLENIFFINKKDLNELINSNSLIEKYLYSIILLQTMANLKLNMLINLICQYFIQFIFLVIYKLQ